VSTTTTSGTGRETQSVRSARARGALLRAAPHHHFASKTELAAAVVEQLDGGLVDLVVAAALRGSGVPDQLHRGDPAYMDGCAEPTEARIHADAPAVLGIEACRALDAVACAPLLAEVFARAEEEQIAVPG
jgi:AcrR family transcriptional regulator